MAALTPPTEVATVGNDNDKTRRIIAVGHALPAASRISVAIASGWEISETWLALTSMVLAPIRFAINR